MADVAKLARVSHQTVSRVLHDSPHVKGDTRQRVLDAIRQLNYRPNTVAQALVTGRTMVIGVVSFDTALYGPASTLIGIEEAAHEAGYAISITSLRSLNRASVLDAVLRLRNQGVDGVVVIAPQKTAVEALRHLPPGVPVVTVEAGANSPVPMVAVDQRGGAMAATQHLLDLGHRTVWHIAGPADWIEAEQRVAGWRAALKKAGAPAPPLLRGDWSAHSGYELGRQLVQTPDVTAVFVANDQMALGLLCQLHEAGREIPRQISIVGFDDIPEAAYFTPPLTTVRQDFAEVGRRCIHLLLGQLEGSARTREHVVVPTQLILRKSTSPAKRR
ncbi:LacI family DNA-binding transcriptional regulator [Archangium violaceum]|uniref:LacI family DNA-binding transcriptional regulator n=1 Tax=Archangium violaceum TaxID=83451 RepID=UPI00193AF212|nr:LacI family DNA-binding transcriptional regulator [Archangium violaceum]QRK11363.1 LacI family DNA-binding transcriptional regulator [Archangium violaceum]